jgi:ABC-type dipeptide/oligopeptide/nickel transport system permease subunit
MTTPAISVSTNVAVAAGHSQSLWAIGWRKLKKNPAAMAGLWFIVFMLAVTIFGPMLSPYNIEDTSARQFQPPGAGHWFGTDWHGRDVLTRTMWGGRLSLLVGVVATLVSLTIGVLYGVIAGYAGGRVDSMMMRIVDILYSLPNLVFVIVLIAFLEEHMRRWFTAAGMDLMVPYIRILLLFVGLGALQWLTMARIVRGQVLSLREQQFVLASRALGAGAKRIIMRHLIPNVTGPVLAYLTLTIPAVMLREAFLSFLGLGIQPPQASWGSLVAEGASMLNPIKSCWWLVFFPGMAMALTLLSLNFLGDGLRDALDPKTQK